MKLDPLLAHFRSKPGATEGSAWGPEHRVFKVGGKVFGVVGVDDDPLRISLKCDPDRVQELRAVFDSIQPPPYFNKRHWNLIILDGTVPEAEVESLIDHSYELVFKSLTRKLRDEVSGSME